MQNVFFYGRNDCSSKQEWHILLVKEKGMIASWEDLTVFFDFFVTHKFQELLCWRYPVHPSSWEMGEPFPSCSAPDISAGEQEVWSFFRNISPEGHLLPDSVDSVS